MMNKKTLKSILLLALIIAGIASIFTAGILSYVSLHQDKCEAVGGEYVWNHVICLKTVNGEWVEIITFKQDGELGYYIRGRSP